MHKKLKRIICIIIINGFLILFPIYYGALVIFELRSFLFFQETSGKLEYIKISSYPGTSCYCITIQYTYFIDNTKYHNNILFNYNKYYLFYSEANQLVNKLKENKRLTIFYNINNPNESVVFRISFEPYIKLLLSFLVLIIINMKVFYKINIYLLYLKYINQLFVHK